MTGIKRLAVVSVTASVVGSAVPAAFAESFCCESGTTPVGYGNGYQPAVYELQPGERIEAPAYAIGLANGYRHNSGAQDDIVGTASAAGGFDTLVNAVKAADLAETLQGKGPFTLFAPTDSAFARLPRAQLAALLADKQLLTRVLSYHVIRGRIEGVEVIRLHSAASIEGQPLEIHIGESVMVNNARLVKTDISTSNGVIHVIDTVLLPPDIL